MARNATYMGPRLKRIRRDLSLTQANLAADLEISPSYVALMERNQRPVTAELLLKLARTYRIDLAQLADDGIEDLTARLQAVLREPIFNDIDMPAVDISDVTTSFPAFAEALIRLHTAYSEEQLELAQRREAATDGSAAGLAQDPVTEVRNFLAARRNCFPLLDDSAAGLAASVSGFAAMASRITGKHGLEVQLGLPEIMLGAGRWHSVHHKRVYVSQQLDESSRTFQLAVQLAHLEAQTDIDTVLSDGRFESENARGLARRALISYWAAALIMPYRPFARAAQKCRRDIEALSGEFGASFEQVAHRLTTLQRPGEEGVPFFFIRVDRAGNVSKRLDGAGFPFARHGGGCPLWNVHACFSAPGEILTQNLELPDGQRFFSIARTVSTGGGSFGAPRFLRAVALACAEEHAHRVVYADGMKAVAPALVGVGCHLCHRPNCLARSAPPIGREIRSDRYREPGVPYPFAGE
jgi:predicted transcriptional regulator/transcriptional regulator with XRE-family HTH domain